MDTIDWVRLRANKFANATPPAEWPLDVKPISQLGVGLFGIHTDDGRLFWDGREIITRHTVRLRGWEFGFAAAVAVATVGMFVIDMIRVALGN